MQNIEKLEPINSYQKWMMSEGIPIIREWCIDDVMKVQLKPWARTGGLGAYLDFIGSDNKTGCYICQIPPGKSLNPEKHMFEELIYVLSGSGFTSVWNDGSPKQTFNWQEGSLFSPPLNCWHQISNAQPDKPVRLFVVSGAPTFMNLFHNTDFSFNNNFVFNDRYSGASNYFSDTGKLMDIIGPVWESNFIKDVRTFKLSSHEKMGAAFTFSALELCQNTMEGHIADLAPGTYKKAHRHDGGNTILIVYGKGYTLMWRDLGQLKQKYDWHQGSAIVPPEGWWHQHFVTEDKPARVLALRFHGRKYHFGKWWGVDKDVKEGGDQIEYHDEDPDVRELFERELAKEGLRSKMDESLYRK